MKTLTALFVFFGSIILYFQAVTIYIVYQLKGIIEYNHFWKSIDWLFKTHGTAGYDLVNKAFFFMLPVLCFGVILTALIINYGKSKTNKTLHGSARWANLNDIKQMGLLSNEGVIVGAFKEKKLFKIKYIRLFITDQSIYLHMLLLVQVKV